MADQIDPDTLRARFCATLSAMYRSEVPKYGILLDIVAEVNEAAGTQPARLGVERHGAIRLGSEAELAQIARLFALLGMQPVGYYDLAAAGLPVHSTAFRPIDPASLAVNPFRVFTSVLRLELVADPGLRAQAAALLQRRRIFSPRLGALIDKAEAEGGVAAADAPDLLGEAVAVFRWQSEAAVDHDTYEAFRAAHPLVADVVCFNGPHLNHLTPRTRDIDAAHTRMQACGLEAKETIEGPPRRNAPVLLRQTSFRALSESISFPQAAGTQKGSHTARFGEIEQRGVALTSAGRARYDRWLGQGGTLDLPDDHDAMRREDLAFYHYAATPGAHAPPRATPDQLVAQGALTATPITYEDFLPVSAAGIFRSNLAASGVPELAASGDARARLATALGREPANELELYHAQSRASLDAALHRLGSAAAA